MHTPDYSSVGALEFQDSLVNCRRRIEYRLIFISYAYEIAHTRIQRHKRMQIEYIGHIRVLELTRSEVCILIMANVVVLLFFVQSIHPRATLTLLCCVIGTLRCAHVINLMTNCDECQHYYFHRQNDIAW